MTDMLQISVCRENDGYSAQESTFQFFVSGHTLRDVFDGIHEEIELMWDTYVDVDEAELSEDAVKLRKTLVALFGTETQSKRDVVAEEYNRAIRRLEVSLAIDQELGGTSLLGRPKAKARSDTAWNKR